MCQKRLPTLKFPKLPNEVQMEVLQKNQELLRTFFPLKLYLYRKIMPIIHHYICDKYLVQDYQNNIPRIFFCLKLALITRG